MKNTFGLIAMMGVLSAMCGIVTEITAIITVICGILYLFYPTTNINRYEED
jgi:hypothetical protein